MGKGRVEAFSDGVIAILITIMVLELKVPQGVDWPALRAVTPILLVYLLSFALLGTYWNNHHHMFHTVDRVNGKILWANMHLLFWLSLVPFVTAWMSESHLSTFPTAIYGVDMLCAAMAYYIVKKTIISDQGPGSKLAAATGADKKGKTTALLYLLAIPLAYVHPDIAVAIYVLVPLIWIVPDSRIESRFRE
jgi:uncharacterized membrane protein